MMSGEIIIKCKDGHASFSVNMQGISESEGAFLVHSLGAALQLTAVDYMDIALMESDGVQPEVSNGISVLMSPEVRRCAEMFKKGDD